MGVAMSILMMKSERQNRTIDKSSSQSRVQILLSVHKMSLVRPETYHMQTNDDNVLGSGSEKRGFIRAMFQLHVPLIVNNCTVSQT